MWLPEFQWLATLRLDDVVGDSLIRQLMAGGHPDWLKGEIWVVTDPDDPGHIDVYTIESPALVRLAA